MDAIEELVKLLKDAGVTPKFGLRQQGKLPTVRWMLALGSTWEEIGAAIGWHPPSARQWYEMEVEMETVQQELVALINTELNRQHEESRSGGLSLYDTGGEPDRTGVDGELNVEELAGAILRGFRQGHVNFPLHPLL